MPNGSENKPTAVPSVAPTKPPAEKGLCSTAEAVKSANYGKMTPKELDQMACPGKGK